MQASIIVTVASVLFFVTIQVESLCPYLGDAESFTLLAYSTITNTGNTVIEGDIGVGPGSAITGFPPGLLSTGTVRITGESNAAQASVTFLQNQLSNYPCPTDSTPAELGGQTLTPGVYCFADSAALTTALTLNAEGNSSATFIFRIPATLITSSGSAVTLINKASACNVFWQVGSSATLGSSTSFKGVIVAYQDITVVSGATLEGRAFARNGAVTLDTNTVTWCSCMGNVTSDAETTTTYTTTSTTTYGTPTSTTSDTTTTTTYTTTYTTTQTLTVVDSTVPSITDGTVEYGSSTAPASTGPSPTECLNDCPEDDCETIVMPLRNGAVTVGEVRIRNNLESAISFEFIGFANPANPNRGWWFNSVTIFVGDVRLENSFHSNPQDRWFQEILFKNAFPQSGASCGADLPIFVAARATNDNTDSNAPLVTVFAQTANKRTTTYSEETIDLHTFTYTLCCECAIRTQTQEDWGNLCSLDEPNKRTAASARNREIACYRDDNWSDWCFPSGLTVGCDVNTISFSSSQAVAHYLDAKGSPAALTQSHEDPKTTESGSLGGQVAALALNAQLDQCDAGFSSSCLHLVDVYTCGTTGDCATFAGLSVGELLALGNNALGGCDTTVDLNRLNTCLTFINKQFVDGKTFNQVAPQALQNTPCAST